MKVLPTFRIACLTFFLIPGTIPADAGAAEREGSVCEQVAVISDPFSPRTRVDPNSFIPDIRIEFLENRFFIDVTAKSAVEALFREAHKICIRSSFSAEAVTCLLTAGTACGPTLITTYTACMLAKAVSDIDVSRERTSNWPGEPVVVPAKCLPNNS